MQNANYILTRNGDVTTLRHKATGKFRQFIIPTQLLLRDDAAKAILRRNHTALKRIIEKDKTA
jgi:hypothetical protein